MFAVAAGKRLFGKVDKVPAKYHVATLCWHLCYLPLVPLGTFLVFHESVTGVGTITTKFQGRRIPMSAKSMCVAWSRSLLAIPFVIMAIALPMMPATADHLNYGAYWYAVAMEIAVAALLFGPYWIPGIGRATANRAEQLAQLAAAPPEHLENKFKGSPAAAYPANAVDGPASR